jgi:PIN domain nuclease of toxin-antitoxin system
VTTTSTRRERALLVDTHVWIWMLDGDTRRIGPRTRRLLDQAHARDALRVSPVSIFEVSALHTSGRLTLSRSLEQWLEAAIDGAGIRLAPLSRDVAVDAGLLPRALVADPVDRLLVATARQADATLVTADSKILEYAAASANLSTHAAGR